MKDKDGESTPYLASFNPFGAGVIGAAIAVFLTLFIVFLIHKRRQKKKTKPDASLPIISEGQQENLLKSNCFDIETTETTLLKSDSLVTANKDGKRKKGNFYSPTKPRLMKEKNKSSEQTSELKEISETEKIALNTTSNLVSPTSDELTKSSISRDSFSNRLDEEITPPDLPPKLRSVKKDSLTASSPVDNSFNLNNSNNTTGCASEFSTLELPQPKYLQDGDDSETGSLLSNPPPFKPPPPKINIRKHDTFSEPRPHSVKPPILPKSAAVLRSASLKAFEKRPVVPSRNSTKTEEDLLSSRTVPEGLRSSGGNFFNSKKASSPAPRNSSFTANDRSPIKGGIPVLPPLSPNK